MKSPIAIIGGSGVAAIVTGDRRTTGTPYGPGPHLTIGEINGRRTVFLPRHGEAHSTPPHKINYRANLWSLKSLGVERIIATNAVGAINDKLSPGEILVPSDIVDFTRSRQGTFHDQDPVTHVDVSEPYCPVIRKTLLESIPRQSRKVQDPVVMGCTEGPRYETPAEIRMMRSLGCDIVGMTGAPEVFLARELEICYASICFVSNMAAGLQRTLSAREVENKGKATSNILKKILVEVAGKIPDERTGCSCGTALSQARLSEKSTERQERLAVAR